MDALKNVYSPKFLAGFADQIKTVCNSFPTKNFLTEVQSDGWQELELKQRMRRISNTLQNCLPGPYKDQADILCRVSENLEQAGLSSFPYLCIPDFIEQYGTADLATSLDAMESITRFVSCEFAIRPFLLASPTKVMTRMKAWSKHKHQNVRRFSSEGCRPRLPWGKAIPAFKKDPAPVLPILENLKDDESLFVRKSVANNINDIAKDHPSLVFELIRKWKGKSERTDWILKHGSRTLLRRADPAIYSMFGLSGEHKGKISDLRLSGSKVKPGEAVVLSFALTNEAKTPALFRVEVGVDYVKSKGGVSRKLFKISEKTLEPGKTYAFKRQVAFVDLTTRKHYPGKHNIAVVVNGKELGSKQVVLG